MNEVAKPVVLVVEDEPLVRMLAADVLEDAEMEVIEAATAPAALAILERLHGEPRAPKKLLRLVDLLGDPLPVLGGRAELAFASAHRASRAALSRSRLAMLFRISPSRSTKPGSLSRAEMVSCGSLVIRARSWCADLTALTAQYAHAESPPREYSTA